MASPRGRDAIKSAFVTTGVFDLEELDLKIKRWLIVTQLEKFIEVIKNTGAYYITSDVVEKRLSTLQVPAKVRKFVG